MLAECSEEEPEECDPVVEPPAVEPARQRKPPVEVVIDEAAPSERASKVPANEGDQEDGWGQGLPTEPEVTPTIPESSAPGKGIEEVDTKEVAAVEPLRTQDSQGTLVYPGWELVCFLLVCGTSMLILGGLFLVVIQRNIFMGIVRSGCQVRANILGCLQGDPNACG